MSDISLGWESTSQGLDVVLKGGFLFNGFTDALTYYSDFWKGTFSIPPDEEVPENLKKFEQLGWFERQAWDDGRKGCFIKEPGKFPPAIALYSRGWFTKLDMTFEEYLDTMFNMYAIKGWQFFYIEVPKSIPYLNDVLEDMRVASEQLPLLFPDKDWSYHIKKYEDTIKKIKM